MCAILSDRIGDWFGYFVRIFYSGLYLRISSLSLQTRLIFFLSLPFSTNSLMGLKWYQGDPISMIFTGWVNGKSDHSSLQSSEIETKSMLRWNEMIEWRWTQSGRTSPIYWFFHADWYIAGGSRPILSKILMNAVICNDILWWLNFFKNERAQENSNWARLSENYSETKIIVIIVVSWPSSLPSNRETVSNKAFEKVLLFYVG